MYPLKGFFSIAYNTYICKLSVTRRHDGYFFPYVLHGRCDYDNTAVIYNGLPRILQLPEQNTHFQAWNIQKKQTKTKNHTTTTKSAEKTFTDIIKTFSLFYFFERSIKVEKNSAFKSNLVI